MKETVHLNGQWQVRAKRAPGGLATRRAAACRAWLRAAVPGNIHLDLLRAGRIPDPYVRTNETDVKWVGETDWMYQRDFRVPAAILGRDRVLLRCEGLDTLAAITLNGRRVAETDNMFRTWEFDVKRLLKPGRNVIRIRFRSAVGYARKCIAERGPDHAVPEWHQPGSEPGGCYVRKEPCNFGWDWGPSLVTCGIWRDIRIVAFDAARLTDVRMAQEHRRGSVTLRVSAAAQRTSPGRLSARVSVSLRGRRIAEETVAFRGGRAACALAVRRPALWWPNGMGERPLYEVCVRLLDHAGGELDRASRRIGLRTLRVDRRKDRWGESFRFVVNGIPFFAKGANWIPADAILARLTRADYARLLGDAAGANMNMLRAWGGGIYEDDAFYDLCDELGLCVWQDFMFACSAYPTFDRAFMRNVRGEAEDTIRRLRHHPCLALWCGNNELEMGLVGDKWWNPPRWKRWTMSWGDYKKLFDGLLPDAVARLDGERDYWPCSPHSPCGDRAQHANPECGDAHLWDVWHGQKPFEWYRTCAHRFVSEFGFQSFPEPKTVRAYTAPEDRNVTSFVMEHHQRSRIGNGTIVRYMTDWFRMPIRFDMMLWLSQIQHGMAMKYAVEHWRRLMPRCMGALYWQLNDCWPVASWASIDYFGRWKALHYMARRFFAPLIVSGVEDVGKRQVDIHVTSELPSPTAATLSWELTTVAGKTVSRGTMKVRAAARSSARVKRLDLRGPLSIYGPRDLLLWLTLSVGGETVAEDLVLLARPKHFDLEAPSVRAEVAQRPDGTFRVSLDSARPALWTWLDLEGTDARFADNFFHLRPGPPRNVDVVPTEPLGVRAFRRRLRVRSLIDTYAT